MVVRGKNRAIGRIGEEHAVEHLVSIGWQVLDRNWRCNEGELDIIAHDPHAGALLGALLLTAGPVTAVPLLLFAAGTRRVPLNVVGMSQYIAPIIQFVLAWAVFHEAIPPARWAAMVLVWTAVVIFVADAVHQTARRPRSRGPDRAGPRT